jgi:hypothetical protein
MHLVTASSAGGAGFVTRRRNARPWNDNVNLALKREFRVPQYRFLFRATLLSRLWKWESQPPRREPVDANCATFAVFQNFWTSKKSRRWEKLAHICERNFPT